MVAPATRPVIDGCAGPGGWDIAAEALGIRPLGIEVDDAACATRDAAGLWTLKADISALSPRDVMREFFQRLPLWGLIFSPPCQAFSMAGKGAGRRALKAYAIAIEDMAAGAGAATDREWLDDECGDPRGHLVLEPLRWALALMPRWIALEQVEPVLPLWEAMASGLRQHGYETWTGVLSAEQYGVAQTRRRAFLIASLDEPVSRPEPTHQRYVAPRKREEASLGLFDAPEPERIVHPEDRQLLPWVSMAEALGWGDARDVVGFPRRADNAESIELGGVDYRSRDLRQASQRSFALTEKSRSWLRFRATNDRPHATERDIDSPAPALAFGHNPLRWVVDTGNTRSGTREEGRARPTDEPSPPLTTRADQLEWREEEPDTRPTHYDSRGQRDGRTREPNRMRAADEPAPTIAGEPRNDSWVVEYRRGGERIDESTPVDAPAPTVTSRSDRWQVKLKAGTGEHEAERDADEPAPTLRFGARLNTVAWTGERPATTVAGDSRVHPPGHKVNGDDIAAGREGYEERRGENAIRVSLAEALVLQSFPPDYPVQGTKTKQFEQVGNAVPPLLAWAALRAVIPAAAEAAA
jgi:DNA (cytosine-5)-methyltransferase 1